MQLSELMQEALSMKGVSGAAVVSGDGLVLEGAANAEDLGFVGGLITSGLAASRVLSSFLGDGPLQQAMIEYEEGPVLLIPLADADDAPVLVAVLESASVLGRARLALRKLVPEVRKAAGV